MILPLFQRRGLGKFMIQSVYELAHGVYDSKFANDNHDGDTDLNEYRNILTNIVEATHNY